MQIKECVNVNVSHSSVLPPNQLNVPRPRSHKITFSHTNQFFLFSFFLSGGAFAFVVAV